MRVEIYKDNQIMVLGPATEFAGAGRVPGLQLYSGYHFDDIFAARQKLADFIDDPGEIARIYELVGEFTQSTYAERSEADAIDLIIPLIQEGRVGFVILDRDQDEREIEDSEASPDRTLAEKIEQVLGFLPEELPRAIRARAEDLVVSLTEIRELIQTVAISLVFVVGAMMSGIGAGIITAVGFALKGWEIFEAVKNIWRFVELVARARTDEEFRRAAYALSIAIAILGVVVIETLLRRVGGRIARQRRANRDADGASGQDRSIGDGDRGSGQNRTSGDRESERSRSNSEGDQRRRRDGDGDERRTGDDDNDSTSNSRQRRNRSGFSDAENRIIDEADEILGSEQMEAIRRAHASGEPVTVDVGGRTIQYEPDLPASGMTMFGEDGFVVGREAFARPGELESTVLHELHRLHTSQSSSGLSGELASDETEAAFDFARRALGALSE